jgi:hyperosmotically inducible periplasmic protein
MNPKPLFGCLVAGLVAAPVLSLAALPDASGPLLTQFVTDSAITAAVKTTLAATHISGLTQLKVDTEQDGTVWLSGTTPTQEAADRAVEAARNADGVMQVKSTIVVKREAR